MAAEKMITVTQALSEVIAHLNRLKVRWALVGGMALAGLGDLTQLAAMRPCSSGLF